MNIFSMDECSNYEEFVEHEDLNTGWNLNLKGIRGKRKLGNCWIIEGADDTSSNRTPTYVIDLRHSSVDSYEIYNTLIMYTHTL